MNNPLMKRLPREIKSGLAHYMVIFLFFALLISLCSGFLVADNSMQIMIDGMKNKYLVEDGNFEVYNELSKESIDKINQAKVQVYRNYFVEEEIKKGVSIRMYGQRTDIDLVAVHEGTLPNTADEIAIDRLCAKNNDLHLGDSVKIAGVTYKVVALVSLSDYTSMFKKNSDIMFDAHNFGVAMVTNQGMERIASSKIHYNYSYFFNDKNMNEEERREASGKVVQAIAKEGQLANYILADDNASIQFAPEDVGSDRGMIIVLLYILIAIMAFVFAVIIAHNIDKDSQVIGTLLASGYTKNEIARHYIVLPIGVALFGAVVGNIAGYSFFKNQFAELYYNSYCFPRFETKWNTYAFIVTTVIPLIMIMIINIGMIFSKLSISPLRFLRNDIRRSKNKKAKKLPFKKFKTRFRTRVILQNLSNYVILFVGICLASLLLLFGCGMKPMLERYTDDVKRQVVSKYQYVLKTPVETEKKSAEKAAVTVTELENKQGMHDDVSVYGIQKDSVYMDRIDVSGDEVWVTNGISEKYHIEKGDKISLKDKYEDKAYVFTVKGVLSYTGVMAVYTNKDNFNKKFGQKDNYFNMYFSNEKLDDIGENFVATVVTVDDLLNLSKQLTSSLGGMFDMIKVIAIIIFLILIYILIKIVIEKNANNISLLKVFGYRNGEVYGIYITATTIVVLISVALSIPISCKVLYLVWASMMADMSGWIAFNPEWITLIEVFVAGIFSYLIVSVIHIRHINKVEMNLALKSRE
ncbi:MAG: ABC transporter permease [Eubacterium sp.]|nr:ABC transporter permease [Eubacterium sp.]